MEVSIILITYERASLLKETLDSIINQTFRDFEIIVVDNYSTDNTEEVVNSYKDDRIRFFRNHNYGVIAKNRNFGIRKAKGEFIAFCDDDDLWHPQKLEKQIAIFKAYPKCPIVATDFLRFSQSIGDITHSPVDSQKIKWVSYKELAISGRSKNLFGNSSVVIQRNLVDKIGGLDESPNIVSMEDQDYWLRILHDQDKHGAILKEMLMFYRVHDNFWNKRFSMHYLDGIDYFFHKHIEMNTDKLVRQSFECQRREKLFIALFMIYLKKGDIFGFFTNAAKKRCLDPFTIIFLAKSYLTRRLENLKQVPKQ